MRSLFLPAPLAAGAMLLAGCASTSPQAAVDDVASRVAVRGVVGVEMHRADQTEKRAARERRVQELLTSPLSPGAAAEVALLQSPSIQATLAEVGIAQADLAQATRLANPGLSFERLSGGGARTESLGLAADVVDWLTQPLRRRLGEAELERVKLEVGSALLTEIARVKLAFVELQAADQIAARLAQIEELDRAAFDYAAALHAAGNLTALERANAEAGWGETRAELLRARGEAAAKREAVVRALGFDGSESWEAAPLAPEPGAPVSDAGGLVERALAERLDLATARWAVTEIERARGIRNVTRWLPVGIEVGVARERESSPGEESVRLTGPTIELALPIFDAGGASMARLDGELARARFQLAAVELATRSEVRERLAALLAARELAGLYRDQVVPLRREVLGRTLAEYNQMIVGTFEVLAAKAAEIDAERRAVEAIVEAWTAAIELELAAGGPIAFHAQEETKP